MGYYDANYVWHNNAGENDPPPPTGPSVWDQDAAAAAQSQANSMDAMQARILANNAPPAHSQDFVAPGPVLEPPQTITVMGHGGQPVQVPNPALAAPASQSVPQQPQPVQQSALPAGADLTPGGNALPPPQEGVRPEQPPNMFVSNPGSPGGLTMVGRAAQTLVPGAINAQTEAELANARGINEGAKGLGNQADAIDDTLADLADRKPWQDQMRDNEEKAKQAEAKRWYEIAEEEKGDAIDPDRYFKGDYALGKKVLSIVGMAVGGYLQGLNGGENQFERTLDTLINRDIDAQRAALHAKAKGRSTEKSALRLEVDKWGDQLAAEEKLKSNMWDATAHRLDGLAKRATGKTQQENAIAAAQMARAHANEARLKFAELMSSRAAYTPGSGGGRSVDPKYLLWMKEHNIDPKAVSEHMAQWKNFPGVTKDVAFAMAAVGPPEETYGAKEERLKASLKGRAEGHIDPITKQTMELSDRMVKEKIPTVEHMLTEAEKMLAETPKGEDPDGFGRFTTMLTLPGNVMGRVGGGIPQELLRQGVSEKGIKQQQAFTKLYGLHRYMMTGQAGSAAEDARLLADTIGRGDRSSLENMLRRMRTDVNAKKGAILAGVNPQAAAVYSSQVQDQNVQNAQSEAAKQGIAFTPAGK